MGANKILAELVQLSRELGREERGLAILGEGNTSADCGDGTFWVKASGSEMGSADEKSFSRVNLDYIIDLLKADQLTDQQIEEALIKSLVDPSHRKPSVETFFHAICIREGGAKFVSHAHTISVNSILCSKQGARPFMGHLFPDGIVVCGAKPAVLPYIDPGYTLSRAFQTELRRYITENGKAPKILLMENHGIVALASTAKEAVNIHLMADKWAKVILGTFALGGPNFMTPENVERIDNRLDEQYRRRSMTPGSAAKA